MTKELIDQVIDASWVIKIKDAKYRPSNNFNISTNVITSITVYVEGNVEINGMIYYSYWLVLGCTDYE